jgi:flagellar assembly protein FliH
MGVIKAEKMPTSISPFSMRDVENEARGILVRARQQAEQLLAAAQTEGERLKTEAHAQGLAEGRREGTAAGREAGMAVGRKDALAEQGEALRKTLAALTAAAVALDAQRAGLEAAGLQDVVQLSVSVARRLAKRQGIIEPEVLGANLGQVMSFVTHCSDIRIAVHPRQKQTLEGALPDLQLRWPNLKHVEIVEDAALAPGGCRVYTKQGCVDADLDAQLERIVGDLLPLPAETTA